MSRLKVFERPDDIEKYVLSNSNKKIGSGWEGTVYLANDNNTLKLFKNKYKVLLTNDRITTQDLSLESFIFPDELFVCEDLIYGYKAKYFSNDLFNTKKIKKTTIDLEKLLLARRKAIKDIEILTNLKYKLKDVNGNILFNGNDLAIIDTLSYSKDNPKLEDNIRLLDDALNDQIMYIDHITCALNMPFEDKIKRLMNR